MKPTLLVGNDINNINNHMSWADLLKDLIVKVNRAIDPDTQISLDNFQDKPFPLLYEEIYMKLTSSQGTSEIELKRSIASLVGKINHNEIHERIASGAYDNIMTTNYEHSLESFHPHSKNALRNNGLIKEAKFNVFRNHEINHTKFWHIHGDSEAPNSIVLGYEHYSGQLQQMRNYVISGTNYSSSRGQLEPLVNRLGKDGFKVHSWIDLFFNSHVHIIGLGCDFIESDLWWLFTIRARRIIEKSQFAQKHRPFLDVARESKIVYYYPKEYYHREKDQLMQANGIETVPIEAEERVDYYHTILDRIESEYGV